MPQSAGSYLALSALVRGYDVMPILGRIKVSIRVRGANDFSRSCLVWDLERGALCCIAATEDGPSLNFLRSNPVKKIDIVQNVYRKSIEFDRKYKGCFVRMTLGKADGWKKQLSSGRNGACPFSCSTSLDALSLAQRDALTRLR